MGYDRLWMGFRVLAVGLFSVSLIVSFECGRNSCEVETCVDVASFQAMAREAQECAQYRNRLFMIDRSLVFWDLDGDCSEMYFHRALYGCTPEEFLCGEWGTVMGPRRVYADSSYRDMFETILANRELNDLGLSRSHEVRRICF